LTLDNLINRSLIPLDGIKMKNVYSTSVTPNNIKSMGNAKNYLEAKAMYNINKIEALKVFNKTPAAGIPSQRI
jgi:hypothetical protein